MNDGASVAAEINGLREGDALRVARLHMAQTGSLRAVTTDIGGKHMLDRSARFLPRLLRGRVGILRS